MSRIDTAYDSLKKKIAKFHEKQRVLSTVIAALFLLTCTAFLIWFISKIIHWIYPVAPKDESRLTITNISAGDLIGFIGGFLSFIGTMFLGIVAIKQNKASENISKRLLSIEQDRDTPCIYLCSVDEEIINNEKDRMQITLDENYYLVDEDGRLEPSNEDVFVIKLVNPTDKPILNIEFGSFKNQVFYNKDKNAKVEYSSLNYDIAIKPIQPNDYIYMFIGGFKELPDLEKESFNDQLIEVEVELRITNYLGKRYIQKLKYNTFRGFYLNQSTFIHPAVYNYKLISIKPEEVYND